MAAKRSFKDLTPEQQGMAVAAVAVAVPLIVASQRDLSHREAAEVRGPKALWRLVCLNGAGAVAYFLAGRRRA
jgi:hypothetical protein